MRVILLQDVKKQGKKGQTITVKDGYGNYLITNHLAVMETKGSKKILEIQTTKAQKKAQEELEKAKQEKQKIEKITLEFPVKTGKNGQVFGTISTKQIATELKKEGIDIDKRKIKIETQINTLGTTNVKIELHKEVTAQLKVHLKQ